MRKKKVKVEKHNTRIAIFFVSFVCAIILVSIVLKTISVLAQSKFDGSNRFTISVSNDKNLEVVSFSPNKHSISILRIEEENKDLKLGRFLKIPIDGFVRASFLKTDKDVASLMSSVFFGFKDIKTNLNFVDILRLILASRTTPANNLLVYNIASSMEEQKVYKIVEKLFKDDEIEKENQTVEIINTTQVLGLGGRLARFITNMGGNVIQVSTENKLEKNSYVLYTGRKTYTVKRLNEVLGFKLVQMDKKFIADIRIVLGEDGKDPSSF